MAMVGSVFFALCIFTSSYIGVCSIVVLGGGLVRKAGRTTVDNHCDRGFADSMVSVSIDVGSGQVGVRDAMKVSIGSLSWDNFWGASLEMLRERHIFLWVSPLSGLFFRYLLSPMFQHKQTNKWAPLVCMGGAFYCSP